MPGTVVGFCFQENSGWSLMPGTVVGFCCQENSGWSLMLGKVVGICYQEQWWVYKATNSGVFPMPETVVGF